MSRRLLTSVVIAGAMSIPLCGVAWADPPDHPGPVGVGAGGIPGVIGDNLGTDPAPPGSLIKEVAQQPGLSIPDAVSAAFPDTDRTPGGGVNGQSPGADHRQGP